MEVLDPVAVFVYIYKLMFLNFHYLRKREIKERNTELDSLLKKYEELNNKINEIAISKGCKLNSDIVGNLISGFFKKIFF